MATCLMRSRPLMSSDRPDATERPSQARQRSITGQHIEELGRGKFRRFRLFTDVSAGGSVAISTLQQRPETVAIRVAILLFRDPGRVIDHHSSHNLNTPTCNASGSQTFHPKLCEASSVVDQHSLHRQTQQML